MKVGITGHQRIGDAQVVRWVESQIVETVLEFNVSLGITSLAIGADQMYANILKRMNIPFAAIIPARDYEKTFATDAARTDYLELKRAASVTELLPFDRSTEQAFLAAGERVVELSESMIAVWNGLPAAGIGGTADIVEYALRQGRMVIHINTLNRERSLLNIKGDQ
jgi:hypothetical protein